ncbi:glycosyltransferase family 2 protein [Hymenobacter translucens]|uniref:glycosyltransferase family 2 protein n=1 Tax=Hymenobacter translucens TaxID=2886507 RepID=UPI001D0E5865|nr:glycosyltransferase family 2 protein [Hymenobacter translucens]
MVDFSIIIPVYRGENTIGPLARQIRQYFTQSGESFEIIFVYDCGPGRSWSVIQELRQELGPEVVKAIRLSRNFGQHNALICGFRLARGRFLVTMDEDLQHDPADIGLLARCQQEGDYDVVYGKYDTLQHSGFRNMTSRMLKKLLKLGLPDLHPDYTAFRLLKADIARYCLNMSNSYTFLDGYLTWVTNNVGSVTVRHQEGAAGASSYTLTKLIEHSVNIFVTFSDLPIRLLTLTSVAVFLFTTLYSLYIIIRKLFFNDLSQGFASLIIAIGFGIGLLLLGMGILGEYIHRINLKTTRRPSFVEREVLS